LRARWAFATAMMFCMFGLAPGLSAPNPFDTVVKPLGIGEHMPALQFVDQAGQAVTFSAMRGQTVLVGFVYTRCKDACPIITQKFGRLDQLLKQGPYRLVEVTIDPAHDTPAVIAAYAKRYGLRPPRWQILTGQPQELETFDRAAGVSVIDNGRGELVHNTVLLVVNPDGRLTDVVQLAAWDPATIAARLEDVAGKASNPVARADFELTKTIAQFCGGSYQVAAGVLDVVVVVILVGLGAFIALWMRRRIFEQGA